MKPILFYQEISTGNFSSSIVYDSDLLVQKICFKSIDVSSK
jgi:hypothetical protein